MFYGGIIAARSPALSLRAVELEGASSGKVKLADVVSAGKLNRGTSLLEMSTEKAARRIETLAWVRDASVERILPSRIRVRVIERQPAFVVMAGSIPWLTDEQGVVLEQADMGLLHLWDLPLPALEPGTKLKVPQFEHTRRIIDSLPQELRSRLNRVRAASVDRITLELTDGAAIVYGAAEEIADKNHAAGRLLELYDGRGITLETIDVRAPSRPAVKPRAAA